MKKVVLITGCSSGIGEAAALSFARDGAVVYASMRHLAKGARLREIAEAEGVSLSVIELDVARPETFGDVIRHIVHKESRLDVLINNAGVLPIGAFEDMSEAVVRDTMEINFFGPALLSRAALPVMRSQKSGYIIMISSLSRHGVQIRRCCLRCE